MYDKRSSYRPVRRKPTPWAAAKAALNDCYIITNSNCQVGDSKTDQQVMRLSCVLLWNEVDEVVVEREKGRKKKSGMHISFRICARRGPFVVSTRVHTSTRCHNCPHVLRMSHFLQVCLLLRTKCPMHQPCFLHCYCACRSRHALWLDVVWRANQKGRGYL